MVHDGYGTWVRSVRYMGTYMGTVRYMGTVHGCTVHGYMGQYQYSNVPAPAQSTNYTYYLLLSYYY